MKTVLKKYKKHNFKFSDFCRTLENGHRVLDFPKIRETFKEFDKFFIFSERGQVGKTTGLKVLAMDDFEKNGAPSMFLRNTNASLKKEKEKFLSGIKKIDERYAPCDIKGDYCFKETSITTDEGEQKLRQNIVYFTSMNSTSKEKGSRVHYNNLVFDEINEDHKHVNQNYTTAMSSIISSTYDQVKGDPTLTTKWFLGNYKSINHPFLISLGLYSMTDEVSVYYQMLVDNDDKPVKDPKTGKDMIQPGFILLRSNYDESEIERKTLELFASDPNFRLDMATGEAQHTYFNAAINDEAHNIFPKEASYKMLMSTGHQHLAYIKTNKGLLVLMSVKHPILKERVGYLHLLNDKDETFNDVARLCLDRKLIDEETPFDTSWNANVLWYLSQGKLYYSNLITRIAILESLKIGN